MGQAPTSASLSVRLTHSRLFTMADKDRQSRMCDSSVNAPMKKAGAGAHSWGAAMDGQMEYQPTTVVHSSAALAPAPAQVVHTHQPMGSVNVKDASQFPALGGSYVADAIAVNWGPTIQNPIAVLGDKPIREGVEFGHTRPRHLFAKHANPQPAGQHQVGIDWSSHGTAGFEHHYTTAHNNPAHLAPHVLAVQAAQPVVQQSVASYVVAPPVYVNHQQPIMQQKFSNPPQYQMKQMTQGRGR